MPRVVLLRDRGVCSKHEAPLEPNGRTTLGIAPELIDLSTATVPIAEDTIVALYTDGRVEAKDKRVLVVPPSRPIGPNR